MAFDFTQLANALPALGGILGSGGAPGVLAGLGDAAHEQNLREYQMRADARKAFADQLEKIGMDEQNWNEGARTAALQARLSVLSNPKAGEKDFQKHWQSVLDASQRPDATKPASTRTMPQPAVSGPFTPGERAVRQMEAMRPMLQAYGSGNGAGVIPMWSMGPKGPSMHMRVDTSRPLMLDVGEGATVPGYFDAALQTYVRSDTRQPVVPRDVFTVDRPMMMTATDESGQPIKQVISRNNSIGATYKQPVTLKDETVTENGTVKKFTRNPFSPTPGPVYAQGTTPNRDIAERGLGIREQSNTRQQGAYDYNYGATAVDVDGSITGTPGATFVPAGTPTDASGAPIPAKPFALSRPPAAVVTRAHVASDASTQADSVLKHLESADMSGDFGPLRGRALGWLVSRGIIADTDIKRLQLQLASLESMNPAVHQMRNFAIAQDIAAKLGDLGQPYENFVAGVRTLKEFYDQVAKSGVTSVVPTSPQRVISRPKAPMAPKSAPSTAKDPKQMTDDELAAAARAILTKGAH